MSKKLQKKNSNQMELNSAMDAGGQQGIADHDFVVWMGDLNYRIDSKLSLEECYDYIEKDDLETLRRFDQLNIERGAGRVFQNFSEARCALAGGEERRGSARRGGCMVGREGWSARWLQAWNEWCVLVCVYLCAVLCVRLGKTFVFGG